jgi:3-hydroxyisobutyrate dehydrogenase-like beta-hydroxyacid dehydrogenase
MKLAFLGLGRMGASMARNLVQAGHAVTVHNRTVGKAEELKAAGASVAGSVSEAVQDCAAVITMLSDDKAVEETLDAGLLQALPSDAIHISCSTISTKLARRLAEEHSRHRQGYVSAPVFGRPEAAEAKRLLVIAAGPGELLERCTGVFDAIGRQTFVAGVEPWQANAVKLCGNFMIASMMESFGEANATLRKANVDPHLFLEVMTALFASPIYSNYGRIIADEEFLPAGFVLRLGLKDIRLMLETAQECESPMPVASLIRDHFLSAMANGQAEEDWSSVTRIATRNSGL